MSSLTKKIVIAMSAVVFLYVTAGYVMGRSSDDKAFRALTVYSEVLEHVQRDYVDDPNMHQVTSGALHGLLDSLDSQSSYLSPLEYKDFEERSAANSKASAGLALSRSVSDTSVSFPLCRIARPRRLVWGWATSWKRSLVSQRARWPLSKRNSC